MKAGGWNWVRVGGGWGGLGVSGGGGPVRP